MRALGHLQRPQQAQQWGVQQVLYIFIKKTYMARVYIQFFKDKSILNSSSVIQGEKVALGHPQRPRQAQPWGVQQVPFIFIKMNI